MDLIHVTFFGLRDDGDESPDTFSREAWPAFEVALMDGFYPCADNGEEHAGMIECDELVCVLAFVEAVGLTEECVVGVIVLYAPWWDSLWVCLWYGLIVFKFDMPQPVCGVSPSA